MLRFRYAWKRRKERKGIDPDFPLLPLRVLSAVVLTQADFAPFAVKKNYKVFLKVYPLAIAFSKKLLRKVLQVEIGVSCRTIIDPFLSLLLSEAKDLSAPKSGSKS